MRILVIFIEIYHFTWTSEINFINHYHSFLPSNIFFKYSLQNIITLFSTMLLNLTFNHLSKLLSIKKLCSRTKDLTEVRYKS